MRSDGDYWHRSEDEIPEAQHRAALSNTADIDAAINRVFALTDNIDRRGVQSNHHKSSGTTTRMNATSNAFSSSLRAAASGFAARKMDPFSGTADRYGVSRLSVGSRALPGAPKPDALTGPRAKNVRKPPMKLGLGNLSGNASGAGPSSSSKSTKKPSSSMVFKPGSRISHFQDPGRDRGRPLGLSPSRKGHAYARNLRQQQLRNSIKAKLSRQQNNSRFSEEDYLVGRWKLKEINGRRQNDARLNRSAIDLGTAARSRLRAKSGPRSRAGSKESVRSMRSTQSADGRHNGLR